MNRSDAARSLISTGIGGFDEILKGGVPTQGVHLVQGAPGTGKTTLGLQFLMAGTRQGESTAYFTLSQSREGLEAIAASHGFDLGGIELIELAPSAATSQRQSVLETRESELDAVLARLRQVLAEIKPSRIVVDSLLELRLLTSSLLSYRRELLTIRETVTSHGATALVLDYDDDRLGDPHMQGLANSVTRLEMQVPQYGTTLRRLTVLKMRGHPFVEGYHDLTIETGGMIVYPRVVPESTADAVSDAQVGTGVTLLDDMLGGGLRLGTVCLIVGQSGTGKSTLGTVLARNAARKEHRGALFLFEEQPEVFRHRSRGIGLALNGLETEGQLHFHYFNAAETTPGEFSQAVVRAVEKDGVRVVVIDSLTGYLSALPDSRDLVKQLNSLISYLSRMEVLTLLIVAQHGLLGGNTHTDFDMSFLADSIILLRQYQTGSSIRRSIAVIKKRHGHHATDVREMRITGEGIKVSELTESLQRSASSDRLLGS